ncbi:DEBR0S5_02740g1_1 [Brettanomyces bruxellensis]|uniref:Protein ROT1 n=1 Tax=Dekkera bruxellensis TaxID=5007 RepID=A0A7D9D081_DEKBR|nr:DEBR0S5_02740g1_1 [Brettanomyces bruxellensis]
MLSKASFIGLLLLSLKLQPLAYAAVADDTTTTAAAADTTTTAEAAAAAAETTDTTTTAAAAAAAAAAETTDTTTTAAAAAAAAETTDTTTAAAAAETTDTTTAAAAAATTVDTATEAATTADSSTASSDSADSTATANGAENGDTSGATIVGTWTSKSNAVFTGPGFYDPVDELLIEPALTGISYSFTEDGFFEEALYQVTPNPQNHSCAAAALIFQHGTYEVASSGKLTLTPFAVDGRQLLSEPCSDNGVSTYSRYNQTEIFKGFSIYVDSYHGRYRLNLVESNGEYMRPLYLAYRPPQMLPTMTLNPTDSPDSTTVVGTGGGSSSAASASASASAAKVKRDGARVIGTAKPAGLSQRVKRSLQNRYRTNAVKQPAFNYNFWWWVFVDMIIGGGLLFVFAH